MAKDPNRRCIVTGDIASKASLLRFVVGPDERICFDIKQRLPGRGLWVRPERSHLETAVAKRLFSRAARQAVKADESLLDQIESAMQQALLQSLGLARKSGGLVIGAAKVESQFAKERVACLILARDAGQNSCQSLGKHINAGIPLIDCLSSAQLSEALGRDQMVVAAETNDRRAKQHLALATRLKAMQA